MCPSALNFSCNLDVLQNEKVPSNHIHVYFAYFVVFGQGVH